MSRARLNLGSDIRCLPSRCRYSPSTLLRSQGLGNTTGMGVARSVAELLRPGAAASRFFGFSPPFIGFIIKQQQWVVGGQGFETVPAVFMEGIS